MDVNLVKGDGIEEIDSFSIPIELDVRHADINRTWTGISWLEYGVIAFLGGLAFMEYDDKVSPILADEIREPIGEYIAQEIMGRLNNGKVLGKIKDGKTDKTVLITSNDLEYRLHMRLN